MSKRNQWVVALARFIDGELDKCPRCGSESLRLRYIGDEVERIGYALFWCESCLHGINVSRAGATPAGEFRSFRDPNSLEGVPEFTVIN